MLENINAWEVIPILKELNKDIYMHIMLLCIGLDIITGILKSIVTREANSGVGTRGLCKHAAITMLMLLTYPYLLLLGQGIVAKSAICFFIYTYIISIMENLDAVGVIFPKSISDRIYMLRNAEEHKTDEEIKNNRD